MVDEVKETEGGEVDKKKAKWGKAAKVSLGVLGGLSLLMGYISAAGMEESEREEEARKPIDKFFAALNARDIEGCRTTLHYPHIQIAGNELSILSEQRCDSRSVPRLEGLDIGLQQIRHIGLPRQ